jgi:hypothetical protein
MAHDRKRSPGARGVVDAKRDLVDVPAQKMKLAEELVRLRKQVASLRTRIEARGIVIRTPSSRTVYIAIAVLLVASVAGAAMARLRRV